MKQSPTDTPDLLNQLNGTAWRLRGQACLCSALWSAILVSLVIVFVVPFRELLGFDRFLLILIALVGGATLIGIAATLIAPLSRKDVAQILDARLGLDERLQTAVEFFDKPDHPFSTSLTADAELALARASSPRIGVCLRGRRRILLTAPLMAVLVSFFPAVPSPTEPVEAPTNADGQSGDHQSKSGYDEQSGDDRRNKFLTAEAAFKDTAFESEPPDFVSFVRSGGDHLALLVAPEAGSEADPSSKPYEVPLKSQAQGRSQFEPGPPGSQDIPAEIDAALPGQGEDAKSGGAAQTKHDSSTASQALANAPAAQQPNDSASTDGDALQHDGDSSTKGVGQNPTAPAEDSPGTPSTDQVQDPDLPDSIDTKNQAADGPRFGGGQYPHNAPGAGFPDWLLGPEDPHFMDAGQGKGESTGKTSGQAGVGHAPITKGQESVTIEGLRPKDMRITGARQEGHQTSYQTDALAAAADGLPQVLSAKVDVPYEFQAEEPLSKDIVPERARRTVKAYFARIR